MKYVAYTNNHINNFINNHINNFIQHKKLFKLLELPIDILIKYTSKELIRINSLFNILLNTDNMLLILNKCILNKVTIYNVNDVIKYLHQYNDLVSGKIKVSWGCGNHSSIEENIIAHYNKHILSSEGEYWINIIHDLTLESYMNYPISNFTKMKRIVVHSNGRNTYLSGFVGNIFIVGRYDGDVFGISSCYYVVEGEKYGRYSDGILQIPKII